MARTESEILEDIALNRAETKALHAFLECLIGGGDKTLDLIRLAYKANPEQARSWHRQVLKLNRANLKLTEELCE